MGLQIFVIGHILYIRKAKNVKNSLPLNSQFEPKISHLIIDVMDKLDYTFVKNNY
jgi:hypothetical protein